jgi:hypothetical protein
MEKTIQEKLEGYVKLLGDIRSKVDDERTAVSLLQEIGKDHRMDRMSEERELRNNKPATMKQKRFMDDLGIKYPKNVTKQEASILIDEELSKNGNGE